MVLNREIIRICKLVVPFVVAISIVTPRPANAVIVHRYLLDGDTNDSVGTLNLSAVTDFAPNFVSDNQQGGQSAEFTGTNSVQADMTGPDPLKTTVFSLAFWIKYGAQPSGFGFPIARSDGTNAPWNVQINTSNQMQWIARGTGTVSQPTVGIFNTGAGDADPWHHVVISQYHDVSSGYLDGVPIFQNVPTQTVSTTNTQPLRLGRRGDGYLFDGRLDDVQIYTDALQAPEVAYLYSHPGQTVVPVNPLEFQVDRVTGETILRNPSSNTTPVQLVSYTLNSTANTLETSDARWKSFQDAGKPGWFEANPSTSNLSELASGAPLSLMPGESYNFGTPFTVNTGVSLGTNRVNASSASFKYQLPDGTPITSRRFNVRYNDLVLVVDPATGATTMQNQSTQPIELISYTIHSNSGSLLTSYSGSGQPGWYAANPTANNLSELASGNSILLNVGGSIPLGSAWDMLGTPDLTFSYQATNGALLSGTVSYGQTVSIASLPGDYNGNGKVDAADYVLWRKNPSLYGGTPGGYNTWRSNFGNPPGAGSGKVIGGAQVPEPSAMLLTTLMLTGCVLVRLRK